MSASGEALRHWYRVLRASTWVTFLEIVRDKVLYNTAFFTVIVLGIGYLAARMTFGYPLRIIVDFGYSAVTLSCSLLACLSGASLLNREIERRTAFVALSHPISRAQFLIGKFSGLALVLVANWVLMSAAYLALILLVSAGELAPFSATLFWGLGFALLQSLVLASVTLFFSVHSSPSMTLMFTTGIYLIGTNLSQLQAIAAKAESKTVAAALSALWTLLPNLEHFNPNTTNAVTYGLPLSGRLILFTLGYGVSLTLAFLILASLLFRSKEL